MACADYAGRTKDNLGASQVPLGGSQILRLELKCMPICERIFSCPLFIASRRSRIDSVEFEGALENHGHRAGIRARALPYGRNVRCGSALLYEYSGNTEYILEISNKLPTRP